MLRSRCSLLPITTTTHRLASVGFFFETAAEAEAERKAAKAACAPSIAGDAVVTAVPLATALALTYQPVSKRRGFPGYFCHRFRLSTEVKADALRLSGLESISDASVPVFYEKLDGASNNTNTNADGGQALFLRLRDLREDMAKRAKEAKKAGGSTGSGGSGADQKGAAAGDVGVADLGRIAKQWSASAAAGGGGGAGQGSAVVVGARGGAKGAKANVEYSKDEALLALEWNI